MTGRFAGRTGQDELRYRILIRGEIREPLVGPLEGMSVELAGDESVLTVDLDQAHLQRALSWLNDLGIEIVSINPVDEETGG
jgi:hypothetical protein